MARSHYEFMILVVVFETLHEVSASLEEHHSPTLLGDTGACFVAVGVCFYVGNFKSPFQTLIASKKDPREAYWVDCSEGFNEDYGDTPSLVDRLSWEDCEAEAGVL